MLTRRRFLIGLSGAFSIAGTGAACSDDDDLSVRGLVDEARTAVAEPSPTPTSRPIVLPAGRQEGVLLPESPYETPLYVLGSDRPGPVVLVLGGVHGNEPGGWLAADRLVESVSFQHGSVLIVPHANKLAIQVFERTLPELGDLNRLYPGDPNGLPMERMAHKIVQLIERYRVDVLVDMHESWAFYKDRPQSGTAFLGQTVASYPNASGPLIAQAIVAAVNQTILYPHEELFYRDFPSRRSLPEPAEAAGIATPASGGSRSSLGLGLRYPNLAALLVEMGQQQELERRISLHVRVVKEVLRHMGMA